MAEEASRCRPEVAHWACGRDGGPARHCAHCAHRVQRVSAQSAYRLCPGALVNDMRLLHEHLIACGAAWQPRAEDGFPQPAPYAHSAALRAPWSRLIASICSSSSVYHQRQRASAKHLGLVRDHVMAEKASRCRLEVHNPSYARNGRTARHCAHRVQRVSAQSASAYNACYDTIKIWATVVLRPACRRGLACTIATSSYSLRKDKSIATHLQSAPRLCLSFPEACSARFM